MNQLPYSKPEARRVVQRRLDGVDDATFAQMSATIYGRALDFLRLHPNTKQILSFKPLGKWREIDLSGLEKAAESSSFTYAPQAIGTSFPGGTFDVIFVPLYGFTSQGHRLGHGGGWYDRFLAQQPTAIKVGVGLERCLIEFTQEPHDIPLDILITEVRYRYVSATTPS